MKPRLIETSNSEIVRMRLWRMSYRYWLHRDYRHPPKKKARGSSLHTKRGRDAAVARHRAAKFSRNPVSKRTVAEVISSLSAKERAALVANKDVVSAVEKILEAMLFRFSA